MLGREPPLYGPWPEQERHPEYQPRGSEHFQRLSFKSMKREKTPQEGEHNAAPATLKSQNQSS